MWPMIMSCRVVNSVQRTPPVVEEMPKLCLCVCVHTRERERDRDGWSMNESVCVVMAMLNLRLSITLHPGTELKHQTGQQ